MIERVAGVEALLVRPDWWADAECNGVDPEVFLPQRKVVVDLPDGTSRIVTRSKLEYTVMIEKAKRFCDRCRTHDDCVAYAVTYKLIEGVYGGYHGAELREVVRAGRRRLRAS